MSRIVVVGSGASGVHFALSLLRQGREVVMVDAGYGRPEPVRPEADFNGLKKTLPDPAAYFLGRDYEALILPDHRAEYYGFPPNKSYVFRQTEQFRYQASGFAPLVSFAAGGLAEAWTGGCYPFRDEELAAFPFGYRELEPYYVEVARRIGICGTDDDLARFMPYHDGLMEPLELDEHSRRLLTAYEKRRGELHRRGCFLGRSRVATLSRDHAGRKACNYSGRCLWGCPTDSLYTPSVTLRECQAYPNFTYAGGLYASHFRYTAGGRVTALVAREEATGNEREFEAGRLALAAGTLSSSRIMLESIRRDSGERPVLRGLMDNRQVLMPFVNLAMIGRPFNPNSYQYHQLAIGVDAGDPMDYVHGLVTTLKTALIHPLIQALPFDLGTATMLFRDLHAALGLVNINFSDNRRDENSLALESDGRLAIHYRADEKEPARLAAARRGFQGLLWKLNCVAPGSMTHVRPMGASVHYAGTLPMSAERRPLTCSPSGESRDFSNLYFVDGTGFPALPSKNLTFTLMANAARVAAGFG